MNDRNFEEIISAQGKMLIIAGADWCNDTINLLKNVLPKYLAFIDEEIKIFYAEIEGHSHIIINPQVAKKLNVSRYPTLLAYVDGENLASNESEEFSRQEEDLKNMLVALGAKIDS